MSKTCFLKFEYDELVFTSMTLRSGTISGGNTQSKMKGGAQERSWSCRWWWASRAGRGTEMDVKHWAAVQGLGQWAWGWGESAGTSISLSQEEITLRKRPWVWPVEDVPQWWLSVAVGRWGQMLKGRDNKLNCTTGERANVLWKSLVVKDEQQ